MATEPRWISANVAGLGAVYFQTDDPTGRGSVSARRITAVEVKGNGTAVNVSLSRHHGYALGLMDDPVVIGAHAIMFASVASAKAVEACESAWSSIVRPTPAQMRRLDGNGKP